MTVKENINEPITVARAIVSSMDTIGMAILIAILIRIFAFEPFNIPSSSMVPSLLIGDYLFVSKYSYGYSSRGSFMDVFPGNGRFLGSAPERGDVAVFKLPRDNKTDYIKRIVGLPGDSVQMKHGLLYINGEPVRLNKRQEQIELTYVKPPEQSADFMETLPNGKEHIIRKDGEDKPLDNTEVFTVPPAHYFAMGDNRDNSLDSRTTNVGFIPEENLVGRAEFLFFSIDENARFWQFWKWPTSIRWDRLFKKIS